MITLVSPDPDFLVAIFGSNNIVDFDDDKQDSFIDHGGNDDDNSVGRPDMDNLNYGSEWADSSLQCQLPCHRGKSFPPLAMPAVVYRLVWVTKVALAVICLVFPALVLGYYFFIVKSMTYQFLYIEEFV
jgi:hypothetical protein